LHDRISPRQRPPCEWMPGYGRGIGAFIHRTQDSAISYGFFASVY
jgi:hypothetical protein